MDRLRALVEVGAHGSIVGAADGDPVRQSQYSRQIKELEDFFRVPLVERHGKGLRLTPTGRELARISRFFLLGLSNFQRGCLGEGQTYRIGANRTVIEALLVPALAGMGAEMRLVQVRVEAVDADDVERRLHDLSLDFGVVRRADLSRPLQTAGLVAWHARLWVPARLCRTAAEAADRWRAGELPVAWPGAELAWEGSGGRGSPALECESFLEARAALATGELAAPLPGFLPPGQEAGACLEVALSAACEGEYRLAWNPRLLRLNPHAAGWRDALIRRLTAALA